MEVDEFGPWKRSDHVIIGHRDWTVSASRCEARREKKISGKCILRRSSARAWARTWARRAFFFNCLLALPFSLTLYFLVHTLFFPSFPQYLRKISRMGRRSCQKQHLKQLAVAAKAKSTGQSTPMEEKESLSSDDEVLWSDEELDEHAETTISKLFHGGQKISTSKRPFRYSGNSKRTQKRRRANARQQAAKNGRTMMDYFTPIQASTSGASKGCASEEITSEPDDQSVAEPESDICSENGHLSNEELISILENKCSGTSSEERWRLEAVLQYLRLLKYEPSTVKASLSVAHQLGRDVYLARRIRHWARLLQNGQDIPTSMRGKHVKVKSLLEDEDVQHKILQYLRTSKFEFYLADFVQYVSNDVFPSLGISQATPIGYETFYYILLLMVVFIICCSYLY